MFNFWFSFRFVFLLLILSSFVAATNVDPVSTGTPATPLAGLKITIGTVMAILAQLMVVMLVIAAVVYMLGTLLGSEMQARATVWAHGMVASVFVAAVLIALLLYFIPSSYEPGTSPLGKDSNLLQTVARLWASAEGILGGLIMTLFVCGVLIYMLSHLFGAETRAKGTVWSTALLSGAMFASVLYVLGFAVLPRLAEGANAVDFTGSYYRLIALVMMLLFVIMLLTYLVAKVFRVPEWEAYLSVELSTMVNSYLILFFMTGMFLVGDGIAIAMSGHTSVPEAALYLLKDNVAPDVLQGMFDVFKIQTCASMLSTFARRIGEYVLTNAYKLFPGTDTFVSISNVVGYGLVAVYGSVSAQMALFALVEATMKAFFLPAGLVLRFFPPTREAGSFIIAAALGFQIVFPLCYIINFQVINELGLPKYDTPTALIGMVCGPLNWVGVGWLFNPGNFVFSSNLWNYLKVKSQMNSISNTLNKLVSDGTINAAVMLQFLPILQLLSRLTLTAIFLPAFSMVVTIAFINATTKFLVMKG